MSSEQTRNDKEIIANLDFLLKLEALENEDLWDVLENIESKEGPELILQPEFDNIESESKKEENHE